MEFIVIFCSLGQLGRLDDDKSVSFLSFFLSSFHRSGALLCLHRREIEQMSPDDDFLPFGRSFDLFGKQREQLLLRRYRSVSVVVSE